MTRSLLLDTANLDEIDRYTNTSAVAGVTTNPSLMAKEKKGDYVEHLRKIVDILSANRTGFDQHLSVEVISLDPQEMISQAVILSHLAENKQVDLHVKIPVMVKTLDVITELHRLMIKVNATACVTAEQAFMASKAGADIVSFFYRRMLDNGDGGPMDFAHEAGRYIMFAGEGTFGEERAKIICGSIRSHLDVFKCFDYADYVTVPAKIIDEMMHHPKTDFAIKKFQSDIDTWQR